MIHILVYCFASLRIVSNPSAANAACDVIAEREAKERSKDHQLPSPASWARQVPLGSMIF